MTTRAQRGDPMEGWNDCPSFMLKNASSTSFVSGNDEGSANQGLVAEIDINDVINQLTELPTKSSERVHEQIRQKLVANADAFSGDQKQFIAGVLKQLNHGTDVSSVKSQIVDYMVSNDGVTSWCSPLKALVGNVQK